MALNDVESSLRSYLQCLYVGDNKVNMRHHPSIRWAVPRQIRWAATGRQGRIDAKTYSNEVA